MRKEISIVAGAREWGDTRESWLGKVPGAVKEALGTAKQTVTRRTVKALWYREIDDPEHHAARDVRRAAELISARKEARALADKFQSLAGGLDAAQRLQGSDIYRADIARLERVARLLGGIDRAG